MDSKAGAKHSIEKKVVEKEKAKVSEVKDQSFWALLEGSLSDILTPEESAKFIAQMRKVITMYCDIFIN